MALTAPVLGIPDLSTVATNVASAPEHPATNDGDLELMLAGSNSGSENIFTSSPGWDLDGQYSSTADTVAPSIFGAHRTADGTESGAATLAHGTCIASAVILGISGVDPTTPIQHVEPVDQASGINSWPMPELTIVADGSAVIIAAIANNATSTFTPPTDFTMLLDGVTDEPGSRAFSVHYKTGVAAGTFQVPNLGLSNNVRGLALVYVINPDASAPPADGVFRIWNATGTAYVDAIRHLWNGTTWD